ncbi:uncharacterized protein LOC105211838 [Zeugodacus cucurbitae]|uniref:uncharacterized protein LOC105211838 n=1 Tax=Zeugodacus cucurbitae TaxID=28588 RepID=UPI000596940A|nr:uncharacterized protein LOC105211838 [Zeugodacus cucurbitae]
MKEKQKNAIVYLIAQMAASSKNLAEIRKRLNNNRPKHLWNLETLAEESTEELPLADGEPAKKKKRTNVSVNIQNEFLEEFRASNRRIAAKIEAIRENDRKALQIEGKRNVILEKFLEAFKQSK